jgi:hypothetical protein
VRIEYKILDSGEQYARSLDYEGLTATWPAFCQMPTCFDCSYNEHPGPTVLRLFCEAAYVLASAQQERDEEIREAFAYIGDQP